jgi:3-oxoacyl-[acyl-carrier-protein] synthase II
MTEGRRVVITGVGSVNAAVAGGTVAVADALAQARSPIAPVRAFAVEGCPSRLAAEVGEQTLGELIDRDEARRLTRICRLAVAAAELAVRDAGVPSGTGLAVVVGTEHGDFRSSEEFAAGFLRRGPAGLSPMIFPNTVMNSMASMAAIAIGAKAPSITLNQATVAGDLAVARAVMLIQSGRADAALAGGVDEICEVVYRRLAEMGVLSPMRRPGAEGCRPYHATHNGPVLGEGATFLVLEERAIACARNAKILAEVVAATWGNVPVARHRAWPARGDRGSPVSRLLQSSRQRGEGFSHCYGSGNGDPALDDWECALLDDDLGAPATPPASLAPLFGQHGGLGALRVAAAALDASRGSGPALVHGLARGGCRTALVVASDGDGQP